jgi:hypothetical protein
MIGAHIRYNSNDGWHLVRSVRDTRRSALRRTSGLGAPIKLVDEFRGWHDAVAASCYPLARAVNGSDNLPVDQLAAANADPVAEAHKHLDQYILSHVAVNGLQRVEVLNEPRVYTARDMAWLSKFLYAAAERLHGIGVRAVLGNFAAGSPGQDDPVWREARPLAEACQRFGAGIGAHDYFFVPPISPDSSGVHRLDLGKLIADPFAWRSDVLYERFLDWGFGESEWVKTEAGFEWHANVPGSNTWRKSGVSDTEYGRIMTYYASKTPWHVFTFTSGDATGRWENHGVDGSGYTNAVIEAARSTVWMEAPLMDTPATPRNKAALFGFAGSGRMLEVRLAPGGEIHKRLPSVKWWVDVFEVRTGHWRVTDFGGSQPDWWVREFQLQPL